MKRFLTLSGRETEELGGEFSAGLDRGDVVLIRGELGAGKTTFVRGVCQALDVTGAVTSPTFTIGQTYEGKDRDGLPLLISHLDLYRLKSLEDEDPGLIDDYFGDDRLTLLEWPEVAGTPLNARTTHRVVIEHDGGDRRLVTLN